MRWASATGCMSKTCRGAQISCCRAIARSFWYTAVSGMRTAALRHVTRLPRARSFGKRSSHATPRATAPCCINSGRPVGACWWCGSVNPRRCAAARHSRRFSFTRAGRREPNAGRPACALRPRRRNAGRVPVVHECCAERGGGENFRFGILDLGFGRWSRVNLFVATTQWLATVRVKALLGCFTRRREAWRASVPTSRAADPAGVARASCPWAE